MREAIESAAPCLRQVHGVLKTSPPSPPYPRRRRPHPFRRTLQIFSKIASKLVRTYTDRHGLKELCRELLDVDLSKAQQSSDWGAPDLSDAQLNYAASDVLHLHALKDRLETMLDREGRRPMAEACFDFVLVRSAMDLAGFEDLDIFSH